MLLIPSLFVLVRCLYAPMIELSGDEAYYWVWSRDLSAGYFDHPPMVAWLIWLATQVMGDTELAVRLPGVLLTGGTMLVATLGLRTFCKAERRTLLGLQVLLFCSPLLQVAGAVMTPDTPAIFFTTAAVVAGLHCLRSTSLSGWALLGVLCGAAMLSKYTALLPVLAILIAVCLQGRQHAMGCLLAGTIAALVVSPMVLWNARHAWVSFAFQLGHGMGGDARPWWQTVPDFVGAQLLVATPILFVLMLGVAGRVLRGRGEPARRMLALVGLSSLAFFAVTAFRHKVEANWPALAWPPLLMLLALQAQDWCGNRRLWYRRGLVLAGVAVFSLHLTPALLARINKHSPLSQIGGWERIAAEAQARAAKRPIVASRYQDAALLSFYLPGHPSVPSLRKPQARRSQYDLLPPPPAGEVFLVSSDPLERENPELCSGRRTFALTVVRRHPIAVALDDTITRARFGMRVLVMEK